jgi:tetratricopeptide (TPR) repeat protein
MQLQGEMVRGTILLIVGLLAAGAFVTWTIVVAEDRPQRIVKWLITIPVLVFLFWKVGAIVGQGGYAAGFVGIPLTAACGLVLAIIWAGEFAGLAARPLTSLFDGGSVPPEPRPLYSVAQARQKQGRPFEAIAEVQKQLAMFPTDFEGQMLLAQIQAEDLKDLPAAESTIQNLCAQSGHAPRNIVFALYSMADWHLAIGRNAEAARRNLENVLELLPDTEFALGAAQRIAHLGTAEMLLSPDDPKKFAVPESVHNLGLVREQHSPPPEKDPVQLASEYVKHLQQHPLDTEAREKLAGIYARHYGRLDLAADELEQMIAQPHQPAKLLARWLNLLADFQAESGAGYETVKQTLQRIIDRAPKLAAAETARKRIDLLKLELKAKEKSQAVPLGSYEQNIGLKRGLPHKF